MTRARNYLALWIAISGLGGCVSFANEPSTLTSVRQTQRLYVGKIELYPRLQDNDQSIRVFSPFYSFDNKGFFVIDERCHIIKGEPSHFAYGGGIDATLGKTFFRKYPAQDQYLLMGMIQMNLAVQMYGNQGRQVQTTEDEKVYLPGIVRMRPGNKSRAVYIGTIRFHRNPYFEVDHIEIVDEYDKTKKEFEEKYGQAQLTKQLATVQDACQKAAN